MANPMAVTLDQYNTGIANFQAHYFLSECSSNFGGQTISTSWSNVATAVTDFISDNDVDPNSVALRFVICYDSTGNALYLRMQILTMTADARIPNQFDLNATPCAWYEITATSFGTTAVTDLSDATYLSSFYYCNTGSCSARSVQQLSAAPGNYTQNVVFPWAVEVLQMYTDNGSPADASIGFTACSYEADASAPTTYPQTIDLFILDASGDALIDNNPATGFQGKAADMGSMCPIRCDIYVYPS